MPSRQRNNARDDILRVFAEMVARNGYAGTSIGDVAAALGLSKGTVVYHFNSKLELLEGVHLAYIRRGPRAGPSRARQLAHEPRPPFERVGPRDQIEHQLVLDQPVSEGAGRLSVGLEAGEYPAPRRRRPSS